MGIHQKMHILLTDAPEAQVNAMELPVTPQKKLTGKFDLLHVFVNSMQALEEAFVKQMPYLKPAGMLGVSWPKSGKQGTDLNLKTVIRIGYDHGMVESKCISIDDTWSALKFTFPQKGKKYHNSYGTLKH
jgi:hypothetical protein